jgi:hypothetical protein
VCDQWDDADDGGGDAARDRVRTIVDRESDRGATTAKSWEGAREGCAVEGEGGGTRRNE